MQVQTTGHAKLKMSVDQYQYFWMRIEHILGATEVNRCARAFCPVCGEEHFLFELFNLTRVGDKRTGKCGHLIDELLATWNG